MFEMKSENRKVKVKDICLSALKSYSFDKVETKWSEAECTALKNITEREDYSDRTKYLEGIKSLFSDSSRFMQLTIDESKWINYEEKISEKEFDSIYRVETTPGTLYGNPKVHKTVVNNTPKFQPILSTINTPTYLLGKYLNPNLSPRTTNQFTVKNYFDFAKEVVNYEWA